jgi:hypothetical protein
LVFCATCAVTFIELGLETGHWHELHIERFVSEKPGDGPGMIASIVGR